MSTNRTPVPIDNIAYNVAWHVEDGFDDGAHTEVGVWCETYRADPASGRYVGDLPDARFWTDDLEEAVGVFLEKGGSSLLDTEVDSVSGGRGTNRGDLR
jgi:hypothetical protein